MKRNKFILISAVAVFIMTGCASVKFYSDSSLRHKTGLKVYSARPYILSDNSSGKDKISVIWLPDLKNPQYLRLRTGIGSNSLKIELKDGSVTSFGITAENTLPEAINSLSTLLSKSASAIETLSVSPGVSESSSASFDLYEIDFNNDTTILRRIKIVGENSF